MLGAPTVRVGVTGTARAGKTAFLTSVAANLLAGRLPSFARVRVSLAAAGAGAVPRFGLRGHLAALAADPPTWPERTGAVSLLALDLLIPRRIGPERRVRLEFLDYPGEWLLDLPMLRQDFTAWSQEALQRLEAPPAHAAARPFLAFAGALPAGASADEAVAEQGHRLYRDLVMRLRAEDGLSLLQPGRFLMPAPGPPPPWITFFPFRGRGGLHTLLAERYDAYRAAVRTELVSPLFGEVDRLVVLADLLGALHAGSAAFDDAAAALGAAASSLRWRRGWWELAQSVLRWRWPGPGITRVAYCATKADHVAQGQRGNLASTMRRLVSVENAGDVASRAFAIAAVRCTTDATMALGGRAVSAVEGVKAGVGRVRSYPGEVPDGMPPPGFWSQPFFDLPDFLPPRLTGRDGVPELGLDAMLSFLLEEYR